MGSRHTGMALISVALLAAPAHAETLAEQVNRAIERGIAATRLHLDDDGAGTTKYHKHYPAGDTALLLYTLVKSGVSPDDPQVKKSLGWLRYQPVPQTYTAGVYILALDALQDPQFAPQITAAANWLQDELEKQSFQRFAYPHTHQDLSNTQYGVLGLWTAERHGFRAKVDVWGGLLTGVVAYQKPSGGFSYRTDSNETGAMTVGALMVLELALERVPESSRKFGRARRAAKAALAKGWRYLERQFVVDANPHGPAGHYDVWKNYYLYGVERLAAIGQRTHIGTHDWYAEGARHLVDVQNDDGSWGKPWETCFALLFLRRATFTGMGGDAAPVEGEGVAEGAPAPSRPEASVGWVRRWLVLGPVPNPKDTVFDDPPFDLAKAEPRAGRRVSKWAWRRHASRLPWVQLAEAGADAPNGVGWAFTYLHAAENVDAVLWIGNGDAIRVVLDGEVVLDRHTHVADSADRHPVPVRLAAGMHRLTMQVEDWAASSPALSLRIARPDGTPCAQVRPSLATDGADLVDTAVAQPDLFTLDELLEVLPRSRRLQRPFATVEQYDRTPIANGAGGYPCWRDKTGDDRSRPPNPGASGFLGMHGTNAGPMRAFWKVRVPAQPSRIRVRASSTPAAGPGRADCILRVLAFDGKLKQLLRHAVGPDAEPSRSNWKWFEADLTGFEEKDVLFVIEAHQGGRELYYDDLWIDGWEIKESR